ncbi:MAG: hypothetical protein V9G04_16365 [Nocardioides sp.]
MTSRIDTLRDRIADISGLDEVGFLEDRVLKLEVAVRENEAVRPALTAVVDQVEAALIKVMDQREDET